jgi:hypothetical protein
MMFREMSEKRVFIPVPENVDVRPALLQFGELQDLLRRPKFTFATFKTEYVV